MIVYVLL